MRIGELAAAGDTTTKTIRYYESIDLLDPPRRTASGYRDYGPDAVERLRFIRAAQASGLTLTEIRSITDLKDHGAATCDHTLELLHRHLAAVDDQIRRLTETRSELAELASRADALDPAGCTDPHRCQVITRSHR